MALRTPQEKTSLNPVSATLSVSQYCDKTFLMAYHASLCERCCQKIKIEVYLYKSKMIFSKEMRHEAFSLSVWLVSS